MRAARRLTVCTSRKPLSLAARQAVDRINQLMAGQWTPEDMAQERAELDALRVPRQPMLPLKVKP